MDVMKNVFYVLYMYSIFEDQIVSKNGDTWPLLYSVFLFCFLLLLLTNQDELRPAMGTALVFFWRLLD
jgi:hypothetical protein